MVGKGKGFPLLIIHGGPGGNSCSGIPGYSKMAKDRPVIFYDQLGAGRSERPTDTSLWNISRFVDEIDSLRKYLGLKSFHLMGHSWGGIVLAEYLLNKNITGVQSAIFQGPLLSTSTWINDAKILIAKLPVNIQDTIFKYENLKDYKNPAYLSATDSFYSKFFSIKQWLPVNSPECIKAGDMHMPVYEYMWGPTEFTATGTLLNYDITSRLHEIKLPVLFVGGEFDEARPETLSHFQKLIPGAKHEVIPNAAHMIILDQPVLLVKTISRFMASVEK